MLPVLETDRCLLRAVCIDDINDMYEYASNDEVVEFMTFPKHNSIEDTKKVMNDFFISKYEDGTSYDFGIVYKENSKFIGTSGFVKIVDGVATLGYCLNPQYWNKGIMTEVVTEVMRFAFDDLKVNKIISQYYDGNDKSGKVMKKCNMNYIGYEEKEIKVQGNMTNGILHTYELNKEDYYSNINNIK